MDLTAYLTTREVATLLRVHEKQVYALIKDGDIPCTRSTGKWLFPRRLIDQWLAASCERRTGKGLPRESSTIILAGSDDMLLASVGRLIRQQASGFIIAWSCLGSVGGLHALRGGAVQMASCHLDASDSHAGESGTRSYVRRILGDLETVAITFAERRQGWIVARGNPKGIRAVDDLSRKDVRLINRQEGSGTRLLLDRSLRQAGVKRRLRGPRREVSTHLEVAMAVTRGEADVGLGTESAAAALGLDFVPLQEERYHLIMRRSTFESAAAQAFLDVLHSAAFARLARGMAGYSVRHAGALCWDDRDDG